MDYYNEPYYKETELSESVSELRDRKFTEEEEKEVIQSIDKWLANVTPYKNYYDDVEFMKSFRRFIKKDGYFSSKQLTWFFGVIENNKGERNE